MNISKKAVLYVILGIGGVTLLTTLVSGLASSICMLGDYKRIYAPAGLSNESYAQLLGGLLLGAVVLGIVFATLFLCKNRKPINIAMLAVFAAYALITIVCLRIKMPHLNNDLQEVYYADYELFEAYISAVLTALIAIAILVIGTLILGKAAAQETGETNPSAENEK